MGRRAKWRRGGLYLKRLTPEFKRNVALIQWEEMAQIRAVDYFTPAEIAQAVKRRLGKQQGKE